MIKKGRRRSLFQRKAQKRMGGGEMAVTVFLTISMQHCTVLQRMFVVKKTLQNKNIVGEDIR